MSKVWLWMLMRPEAVILRACSNVKCGVMALPVSLYSVQPKEKPIEKIVAFRFSSFRIG